MAGGSWETLARSANDDIGRDEFCDGLGKFFFASHFECELCRGPSYVLASLIDGRQRHAQEIGIGEIAASNYSHVFRYTQPGLQNCAHGAESRGIIEAEDSVGS